MEEMLVGSADCWICSQCNVSLLRARLSCPQCFEHPWLKQDTNTMKTTKLSKERMKKYILRRKWQVNDRNLKAEHPVETIVTSTSPPPLGQKTGHAVRAIGRLSSMAMMAGVSAKKGSPTEGTKPNQAESHLYIQITFFLHSTLFHLNI